jgi:uncharacterized membrane protein
MFEIIPNWHPLFVHFTVALLLLAVGLVVVVPFIKSPLKEQWRIVAHWSLWFGAGFSIITGLAGLYAYNTVAHDTASHAAMTEHRNWALVTLILFLTLAVWSIIWVRKNKPLGMVFVVCMVFAGIVLASTAWHGGEVVYRYGLGVMSLPKAEGEGHDHAHADNSAHGSDVATGIDDSHHDHSGDEQHHEAGMDFDTMDDMPDEHEAAGHDH